MNAQTQPAGKTDPAPGPRERFPSQIKYIVGNETCERFSYYGMMGILELYLAGQMAMGSEGATEVLHLFGAAVYFLPAWILGFFTDRDLNLRAGWKLSGAALMPGATTIASSSVDSPLPFSPISTS